MDDVLKLRDYLYEQTGLYLPDGRRYIFEGQFLKCMEALGISSLAQYYSYLRTGADSKSALGQLINEIAGSETSFFGEQTRFRALKEILIPEIITRKGRLGSRELKIWNAGCASGEEAYALAMVLHSMQGTVLADWQAKVWATDISVPILKRAKLGVFQDYVVQGIPLEMKNTYLQPENGGVKVVDTLKRLVEFENYNFNGNGQDKKIINEIDIIYCSNVLIRFEAATRREIVKTFHDALCEGGYLLLGYYESLHGIKNGLLHVHFTGGMGYRKLNSME